MSNRKNAWVVVCLLAACERAGDSQNPLGTGGENEPAPTGPRVIADAGIATMPNDARIAIADARPATPDAAVKPVPKGRPGATSVAISEADLRRMADLLTGEGSNGRDLGSLDSRRPYDTDLGRQIDDVKTGGGRVGVGSRVGIGEARVGIGGSGPKIDSPSRDTGPTGRISIASKRVTSTNESTLSVDAVLAKIQAAYMAAIKRCYKSALQTDPGLRGRITLAFQVSETGRAVNPTAKGFASSVDDCLARSMASWRFPTPKDNHGEPTSSGFEFVLQLVPD